MPGWTWIDENAEISDEEMGQRTPTLDTLARLITEAQTEQERKGFDRQARYEDGDDGPDYDTLEEMEADKRYRADMNRLEQLQYDARINTLSAEMARLGARMMRPYEHWNEDEGYMQYQECGRFGE